MTHSIQIRIETDPLYCWSIVLCSSKMGAENSVIDWFHCDTSSRNQPRLAAKSSLHWGFDGKWSMKRTRSITLGDYQTQSGFIWGFTIHVYIYIYLWISMNISHDVTISQAIMQHKRSAVGAAGAPSSVLRRREIPRTKPEIIWYLGFIQYWDLRTLPLIDIWELMILRFSIVFNGWLMGLYTGLE